MPTTTNEVRPKTVLLIEDGQSLRWILCEILREAGYYVLEAATAEQAVRIARNAESIDLLICDVLLPGATGGQAAQDISGARPGIPVLFVSGFPNDPVVKRLLARGEAAFLPKPFQPAQLLDKVRAALQAGPATAVPPIQAIIL